MTITTIRPLQRPAVFSKPLNHKMPHFGMDVTPPRPAQNPEQRPQEPPAHNPIRRFMARVMPHLPGQNLLAQFQQARPPVPSDSQLSSQTCFSPTQSTGSSVSQQ